MVFEEQDLGYISDKLESLLEVAGILAAWPASGLALATFRWYFTGEKERILNSYADRKAEVEVNAALREQIYDADYIKARCEGIGKKYDPSKKENRKKIKREFFLISALAGPLTYIPYCVDKLIEWKVLKIQ